VSETGKHIILEVENGLAHITLNRPTKMNAFTPESYAELGAAVEIAGNDNSVDVICIAGAGDAFSTGGDLRMLRTALFPDGIEPDGQLRNSKVDADITRAFIEGAHRAFTALENSPKIVIAAVNGACQGGGLGTALCADFVIATDNASFRAPEGLVGIADPFIPVRLERRVGAGLARRMLFTGSSLDAVTAHEVGLVDELVNPADLQGAVEQLAEQIGKTSPLARHLYKKVLNANQPPFDCTVSYIANTSDYAREGIMAFIERRDPVWNLGDQKNEYTPPRF
jgi:enoyl-CoA hydratase/carnithine racemase